MPTSGPSLHDHPLDRRAALRRLVGRAAAWYGAAHALVAARALHAARPGGAPQRAQPPTPAHPTPRPGVTAARIPSEARLRELGAAGALPAFDEVRQIPQLVDGIRCHCGCADSAGQYSLLSCYEGDAMARDCHICQGQGRLAFRLARAGRTLDEIRAAVDARYG